MLKFRLISPTKHVHYLVPEEQAQALEVLSRTTYKDLPLCQQEIANMTQVKNVLRFRKKDWKGQMGNVFFIDDHSHDIVEFTESAIKTSAKKGKVKEVKKRRPKKEEVVETIPAPAPAPAPAPPPAPAPAPAPAPPAHPPAPAQNAVLEEENAVALVQDIMDNTNYNRDLRDDVGEAVEEFVDGGVNDDGGDMAQVLDQIRQRAANVVQELDARDIRDLGAIDNNLNVGEHNDGRIARMARRFFQTIDAFDTNTESERARRERNRRRRSVIVDWGHAFGKVMAYLSGTHLINMIYLSAQKVDMSLPSPTSLSSFKEIFFDNPAAYYNEYVKMGVWVWHDTYVDERLTEFLGDQDTSGDIKKAAEMLSKANATEILEVFNSIDGKDRIKVLFESLTPDKVQMYWNMMKNEMSKDNFDALSPLENQEFLASVGIGFNVSGSYDYVQERGAFSHEHTFGPNESMGTLFNHAKLVNTGLNPFNDIASILRMVARYTPKDYSSWTSMLGPGFEEAVGCLQEYEERESREFRRNLWAGVGIMLLYGIPTFSTVVNSVLVGSKNVYMGTATLKGTMYTLVDLLTMSSMFTVSMCQLKLLAEKENDGEFSMHRSFGSGSIDWFYTTGAVQLIFTSKLRQYFEEDTRDVGDSTNNVATGLLTLAFIGALNHYDNPDVASDEFFTIVFMMPVTIIMYSFVTILLKSIFYARDLWRKNT